MANESEKNDLKKALLSEDDIGKVVRTHICIERHINEFIDLSIDKPNYLKPIKLDYFGKVNLSISVGLDESLEKPLLQIGTIRNRFAHRYNQSLDTNTINNLYSSFTSEQKEEIQENDNEIDSSWKGKPGGWRNEDPDTQFTVMSMYLFWKLKTEVSAKRFSLEIQRKNEEIRRINEKMLENESGL